MGMDSALKEEKAKNKNKPVAGAPVPSAKPAEPTPESRTVRAKAPGIHGHVRRRVGDVFTIGPTEKLGSWMELVGDDDRTAPADPPKSTPAPERASDVI